MAATAHVDTFARDHLPPPRAAAGIPVRAAGAAVPDAPELRRRAARPRASPRGGGDRACVRAPSGLRWTYAELHAPGQPHRPRAGRRPRPGAGQPRAAARPRTSRCWPPAGSRWSRPAASRSATMPLLRAKELTQIIEQGRRSRTRCATRALRRRAERRARAQCPTLRAGRASSAATPPDGLEARCARHAGAVRRPSTPPPTTPA